MPDNTSRSGVTRGHRLKYMIQGGLEDSFMVDELSIDTSSNIKEVKDEIGKLSKLTHIRENRFGLSREQSKPYVRTACRALCKILLLTEKQRKSMFELLCETIEDSVNDELEQVIPQIDHLATHQSIEAAYIEDFDVIEISSSAVQIAGSGSLSTLMQWGSQGTRNRGDGHEARVSVPFTFKVNTCASDPFKVVDNTLEISVDDSFWSQ